MPSNTPPKPYHSLLQHLADLKDYNEIEGLLSALLTEKEQSELSNRIRIFDLLDQGLTQRAIAQELGVGIATVSRGAKAMQTHQEDIDIIMALITTHRRSQKNK